ncbi:AraC family transcriptional regulator [Biformimicrobium ophioploci]|uniref:AraC family transcriptional regulator n=1 Tax=Biformimicrobium ophioploci TaxID=3036711 RepID=A0ABQ6M240_9GAMM|nr:AraC family transcriptional regulator [Microbulbifer sp. NKW57]GMG88421.1 AraC family transcriptional regulator [Microbulbifer sp. NKW57]
MRDNSIHVVFVKAVLKHARQQGHDVSQLLRRVHISPRLLKESQARVSARQYARLQSLVMHEMGDEMLGYCPQPFRIGQWSAMCHWLIQCKTLGQALKRYCLFYNILGIGLLPSLTIPGKSEGDTATLELNQPPADKQRLEPYAYELFTFSLHRLLCWLAQSDVPIKEAQLPYPQPDHIREYRPLFMGAPTVFNADTCHLVFERKLLEKPIKQTPETLTEFLRHPLYNTVANDYQEKSWSQRTREAIGDDLSQVPTFPEIAEKLQVNPKSLRRSLNDEGLNYSDLKAQLRRDLAIEHLARPDMSVEEIAFRTGFSEASSFIRAFKGWTGVTPLTYRKDLS